MAEFPNRIRALRVAHDWSQDTLALAVGCSKPQISDLERGNIQLTVEWMRRVAQALGVSPGELLNPADNPLLPADEAERELLERFRQASPEQQQNLVKVAEALAPFPAADEERAA